jgi:putative nucleotidyltransferase with HDIG domain
MLKKIFPNALKIGQFVDEIFSAELVESGLKKSGKVFRQETIKKLLARHPEYFVIDTQKGEDADPADLYLAPAPKLLPSQTSNWPQNNTTFNEELGNATRLVGEAKTFMYDMFNNLKDGAPLDLKNSQKHSGEIIDSVSNNASALLCLSRIREKDSYLLEHSIHVGTLTAVFCKYLNLPKEQSLLYVTGAMLHDTGKVLVDDKILHKPSALTEDEWLEMKRHPVHGAEILAKSEQMPPEIISIAYQHHERWDGYGYPSQLKADDIFLGARITSLCDVYDAMTAARCYKEGMNPAKAMKIILSWSQSHFEASLCHQFIHCMGVYPIGGFIRISKNNKQAKGAIVLEIGPDFKSPVVLLVWDFDHKRNIQTDIIDIAQSEYSIDCLEDPDQLNIDSSALLKLFTQQP